MADVFVSYSRSDKARVAPIVGALEAQGWSVWWDPAIAPGQQFDRLIADELERARAVLVVWTPDSVESRWVRGEAREGADRGIRVPVQLGPARLPIDFRAYHTTDLGEPGDAASNPQFQDVVRAIEGLAGRAPRSLAASTPPPLDSVTTSGPPRIAICVLPFANLGGDPEQQYFSDGITGDIITELSRWRLLSVRSRSASFKYRGPSVDTAQVARELNARFVVEGTVRRIADRVRVSVQLTDAESGRQVWAERFDRGREEIFAVQDEVVQTIVSTLVGRVQSSDVERARRKAPTSLDAYECVLNGNALPWDDPEGAAEATRLFEKAIEIDPGYGMAYALLASMRSAKWRHDPGDSTALLDEAYALAKRAVELDDGESTCHSLLAHVCLQRRAYEMALQHMRRAADRSLLRSSVVLAPDRADLHDAGSVPGSRVHVGAHPGSHLSHCRAHGWVPRTARRSAEREKVRRGLPVHDAGLLGSVVRVEGTVPVPGRRRAAGRVTAPRRPARLTPHRAD